MLLGLRKVSMPPPGGPLPHDIAGHVTEDEVFLHVVPHRTFAEVKAAGHLLNRGVVADDLPKAFVSNLHVHLRPPVSETRAPHQRQNLPVLLESLNM